MGICSIALIHVYINSIIYIYIYIYCGIIIYNIQKLDLYDGNLESDIAL